MHPMELFGVCLIGLSLVVLVISKIDP